MIISVVALGPIGLRQLSGHAAGDNEVQGCGGEEPSEALEVETAPRRLGTARVTGWNGLRRRALIVVVDGLKGYGGASSGDGSGFQLPGGGFFKTIDEQGRLCVTARNQADDVEDDGKGYRTMAGFTSILTGVGMRYHGVGDNDQTQFTTNSRWYRSFLRQAKSCGLTTAAAGYMGFVDRPDDGKYGAVDQECGWNTTDHAATYGDVSIARSTDYNQNGASTNVPAHCSLDFRVSTQANAHDDDACAGGTNRNEDDSAMWYTIGLINGCTGAEIIDDRRNCNGNDTVYVDGRRSECTEFELSGDTPDIIMTHMHHSDYIGHHGDGWDSQEWRNEVEYINFRLTAVLQHITDRAAQWDEEWLIAVTADHGGRDNTHGTVWNNHDHDSRVVYGVLVVRPPDDDGDPYPTLQDFDPDCVDYESDDNLLRGRPRNTHVFGLVNRWMGLARQGFPAEPQRVARNQQIVAEREAYAPISAMPAGTLVGTSCPNLYSIEIHVADLDNAESNGDPVKLKMKVDNTSYPTSGWLNLEHTQLATFEIPNTTYLFSLAVPADKQVVQKLALSLSSSDGLKIDQVKVRIGAENKLTWGRIGGPPLQLDTDCDDGIDSSDRCATSLVLVDDTNGALTEYSNY